MIQNYFKIAWRNLIRNKAFSAINIAGMALGIACSLLIMLWVQDERNVDAYHTNGKRIFQVYQRSEHNGQKDAAYQTQGLLASELKRVIPDIEYSSSLEINQTFTFTAGNKTSKMDGSYAGDDLFHMFSYHLLEGNTTNALSTVEGIAISHKMANVFFGSPAKAIGQPIRFENKEDLVVSAVFEDIPVNSSRTFDFIRGWKAYVKENEWVHNWGNASPHTYVQLRAGADPVKVEAKIKDFLYRYMDKRSDVTTTLALQPYEDKYLYNHFKGDQIDGGRIAYVRLFTIVSIFILLIACINFMNLSTARAARRAKEVGVRKVIGALQRTLIAQFTGEALLLTFISLLLALCIAAALLPMFNELTGKQLSIPFAQPAFWGVLTVLLIVTGLIAGSYPAFFLSSLKPVRVLKGALQTGKGAGIFRKGLVVFQFSLSIILITGMIVIYKQIDYFQTINLGYDRENLVYIPIEGSLIDKYALFKEEISRQPGIVSVSKMRNSPTYIEHHTDGVFWTGKDPNENISFADGVVGYDFAKTMKLQMKEGHDFTHELSSDSSGFVINETAAKRMGFKDPIGQPVKWGNRRGVIIGVMKDFHFRSLHQNIEPLILRLDEHWSWGTILVRTQAGKTKEALAALEKVCTSINPQFPFTYQFSDMEYTRLYKSEQVVSKLANYFAFLAIFISCLGLFGLAAFTAEQRTREIGVRKVMGASVADIFTLLTANFLQPVALALLIAVPVAWYVMNNWLQAFAYKIDLEWWIFVVAGLLTLLIAMLTVSFQGIKAALMNPVKSLKAE